MKFALIVFALIPMVGSCFGQLRSGVEARLLRATERSKPQPVPPQPVPPQPVSSGSWWKPAAGASWQIQYAGKVDLSAAFDLFDLDGFDTPAGDVAALHSKGKHAVCYFSAGTYENWRTDANRFPASVLGKGVSGWAGERWLDIRKLDVLGPLMESRMDVCKAKGFDAVDPDNVDGYDNATGFPLSYSDQLAYNRFLAKAAHDRGMAIGLKNDVGQVNDLAPGFDFEVNEQCFEYKECSLLSPFIHAGKPVFNIEYRLTAAQFCGQALALGFSSVRKNLALDAFIQPCK